MKPLRRTIYSGASKDMHPGINGEKENVTCLTEKIIIATSDPKKLLHKWIELVSEYRHRSKFLLSNIMRFYITIK